MVGTRFRRVATMILTRLLRKSHQYLLSYSLTAILCLLLTVVTLLVVGSRIYNIGSVQRDVIYRPVILDDDGDDDAAAGAHFPTETLRRDAPEAGKRNSSCTFFDCFDVYRCGSRGGDKLLVYVYPPKSYVDDLGKPITERMTREFYEILQAIVTSKFYTPDPREACVFIPSVDMLNQNRLTNLGRISQILGSLEFWNEGKNHLIFNMIPGGTPDYNAVLDVPVGKAMIAGASMSSLTFRPGFDTSLPVYGSPTARQHNEDLPQTRSWLVLSTQMNINAAFEEDLLEVRANHPTDLLVLGACPRRRQLTPIDGSIRCDGEMLHAYPEILQTATFCLMVRGARLGQSVLVEAMGAGCIPVIISDSLVMPFHGFIDWMRAAVFIRQVDILSVVRILKSISPKRISEMRRNCLWLWERYFRSMRAITETTLEILQDRIFPHTARDYAHWNLPTRVGRRAAAPVSAPATTPRNRGFTAVVLTYDRPELLFSLIVKLAKVPSLSKILVIWNNQHKDPPHSSAWPKLTKPLKVIQTKENKLSNRFYPYDEIETEAILSIDDDIVMLTVDELEFAYEVWREFPDRIVGFPSRTHAWDNGTGCWRYESEWTNRISMVLTGAAFHHKFWSYMYTTAMPGDIKSWVDQRMNCEDIAMNFLVANLTGKAPIKVTPKKKFRCPECTNTEMLSADLTHMVQRTQCINRFSDIYGVMPLRSVEFRADPVLFRDQLTEKLKRFKEIGSL